MTTTTKTNAKTHNTRAREIADRAADSYSRDRYNNWVAVASGLLKMGLDDLQAEAVMRSKWTRWAADEQGRPYGHATHSCVTNFVKRELKRNPKAVINLTTETFGQPDAAATVPATTMPAPQKDARWSPIRRGDGLITGHIEVWYAKSLGRWVTVPGASRFLTREGDVIGTVSE